jgi:hypothetical protein
MSHHQDAPGLTPPDVDAETAAIHLSDFYVFRAPDDPGATVLVLDVNPFAAAPAFRPDAVYEVCVDTDGDARADIAFRVTFSDSAQPSDQRATVRYETGALADEPGRSGRVLVADAPVSLTPEVRVTTADGSSFFAGLRSDPFFADLAGAADFSFTGTDFFADSDVFAIVLQVPSALVRPASSASRGAVGLWARIGVGDGDDVRQVDRLGNPLVNILFNPEDPDRPYNRAHPADDRATYLSKFTEVLQHAGRSADDARKVAESLLPDVLAYDPDVDGGDPNGHTLTADAVDAASR